MGLPPSGNPSSTSARPSQSLSSPSQISSPPANTVVATSLQSSPGLAAQSSEPWPSSSRSVALTTHWAVPSPLTHSTRQFSGSGFSQGLPGAQRPSWHTAGALQSLPAQSLSLVHSGAPESTNGDSPGTSGASGSCEGEAASAKAGAAFASVLASQVRVVTQSVSNDEEHAVTSTLAVAATTHSFSAMGIVVYLAIFALSVPKRPQLLTKCCGRFGGLRRGGR